MRDFSYRLVRTLLMALAAVALGIVVGLLMATRSHAALTCPDLAAVAQAAALSRMAGETEDSLLGRVPTIVGHLLSDGEYVTARDLEVARQLALSVHRTPILPAAAVRRTLQQCGARQT